MLKKIFPAILIVSLGFIINCGSSLQTGGSSPESLLGFSIYSLPPMISSVSPANNSIGVSTSTQIRILFAEDMLAGTISNATIILTDESNTIIPCPATYNPATRTANVMAGILSNSARYTVTLTTAVMTTTGIPLPAQVAYSFTTVDINTVPAPEFSLLQGSYAGSQTAIITCSEPGSMISYTTDGSTPTRTYGLQVASPATVAVPSTMTLKAMAYLTPPTKNDSSITTAGYVITTAPPVFAPTGGSYTTDTSVTLSSTTPGAVIYYTTDGSVPTIASILYSAAIPVTGDGTTTTIRAMAVAPGYSESTVNQDTYSINWLQVTVPTFDIAAGTYNSSQVITISTLTLLATVYYSTDGGLTWNNGAPLSSTATATISAEGPNTLLAYASATMMLDSTTATRSYTIDTTPPIISLTGPANGARDTGYSPPITVTFNEPMTFSSLTTNVGGTVCSGSLQLSSDGFTTCVEMNAVPATGDNMTFTLSPAAFLDPATVYKFKVTTAARDLAGNSVSADYISPSGFVTEVSGFVDPSFGGGSGYAITQVAPAGGGYYDDARAVFVQPNGKILVAGYCDNFITTGTDDFIMVRYLKDGTLDTTFQGIGKMSYDYSNYEEAFDVAVQSGGRIILAGTSNNGFHLSAYDSAGISDSSFGSSGGYTNLDVSLTEFGTTDLSMPNAMVVDSSDQIYLAGFACSSPTLNDFALVRYDASGILDPTFGGNGIVTTNFNPTRNEEARDLAIQSDGKIVVAGTANNGTRNIFAIARFNTDGSLDATFGPALDGKAVIDFGSNAEAESVAVYPDGRILLAGHTNNQIAMARLNSDGTMDATFNGDGNGDGMILVPFLQAGNLDWAYAAALQKNGKILVAGPSQSLTDNDIAVTRYLANGSLDPAFGLGGMNFFLTGSGNDIAYDMKLQPDDGRIVLTGNFYNGIGSGYDVFVLRFK